MISSRAGALTALSGEAENQTNRKNSLNPKTQDSCGNASFTGTLEMGAIDTIRLHIPGVPKVSKKHMSTKKIYIRKSITALS